MRRLNQTMRVRMAPRAAVPGAVVLAALALLPVAWAQAPGQRERQIRSALVYKVTRFVTWPGDALPERGPFTFCYVSDDATSQVLAGIEGHAIQNRRTRMRRLESPDAKAVMGCNLLYLAGEVRLAADARAAALAAATLVLVDGRRDADNAGMVQLVPRDNRVSLIVDIGMVRAARLRIDATLLQLVEIRP
jgi:YfiR/HmsC-like